MNKRSLLAVVVLIILAMPCGGQEKLTVASSVPLPEELEGKLARSNSVPGCADDGTMMIYADEEDNDVRPSIFHISPNGNVLAHIEIRHLPGFTADYHFAPGPSGETFLLFQGSYPWYDENKHGLVVEETTNPMTELLRFSSTGELLSRLQLQPHFDADQVAVFSSGTIMLIGREIGQRYNRGPLVARLLSAQGDFLHGTLTFP